MSTFYPGQTDYLDKLNRLDSRVAGVDAVSDAATIAIDISQDQRTFSFTLGGNRTINLAGNGVALGDASLAALDGKQILLRIKQDGTGTRVPTWGTGFHFGSDLQAVTLSTTASKTDYVGLIYNHAASRCDVIALSRGY
jgi:hypothetical protein